MKVQRLLSWILLLPWIANGQLKHDANKSNLQLKSCSFIQAQNSWSSSIKIQRNVSSFYCRIIILCKVCFVIGTHFNVCFMCMFWCVLVLIMLGANLVVHNTWSFMLIIYFDEIPTNNLTLNNYWYQGLVRGQKMATKWVFRYMWSLITT
jgi:hypothetical protein